MSFASWSQWHDIKGGADTKFLGLIPSAAAVIHGPQVASGQWRHLFGSPHSGRGIGPIF